MRRPVATLFPAIGRRVTDIHNPERDMLNNHSQLIRLRHLATEYREVRRIVDSQQLESNLFVLHEQFGYLIDELNRLSLLPEPLSLAVNKVSGLIFGREFKLVDVVVGYRKPRIHTEPIEYDDNTQICWGGESGAFLVPGAMNLVWRDVFRDIFCEANVDQNEVDENSQQWQDEHRFETIGYHATACDLLAGLIEGRKANNTISVSDYDFHAAADVAERAVTLFAEVATYIEQAGKGTEQAAEQLAAKQKAIEAIKSELDCLRTTFAIVYAEANKAGDGYDGPVLHDFASELVELAKKAETGNSTWLTRSYFANRATEYKVYWCRIAADAAHVLDSRQHINTVPVIERTNVDKILESITPGSVAANIVLAMLDMTAIKPESRRTQAEILVRAIGRTASSNDYRREFQKLESFDAIKKGDNGRGYYLTDDGKTAAERIRSCTAP
jgi:hypothetical protein